MSTFEAVVDNATVVFDNSPASRIPGHLRTPSSPPMPIKGITTGRNERLQLNGTITPSDIVSMIDVMRTNGWLEGTPELSVLIFDPKDPSKAVIAKTVTPKMPQKA